MALNPEIDGLRLDDAIALLRRSGHALPERGAVPPAELLQGIIDGLCALSSSDALTGLANLRHFRETLERELDRVARTGTSMALLLIDADRFKSVNDTYGHPAGDAVLRTLAERLGEVMRPMDALARYGGEEFAAILPDCQPFNALRVAERYRSHVASTPVRLTDGRLVQVTVSIGAACATPLGPRDAAALVAAADRQLYAAKRAGRDRVSIDTELHTGVGGDERAALLGPDLLVNDG